jgi:hypothetical protein
MLTWALLAAVLAAAEEEPQRLPPPWSGFPPVACYARPSDSGHYGGYYVGGGAPCKGQPRDVLDGTWGWDYVGCGCLPRVYLQWLHGRRGYSAYGGYRIDGPHLLHQHEHESEKCAAPAHAAHQ